MSVQDRAASSVNVTGTDRKIDARLTQPDSRDVPQWKPIDTAPKLSGGTVLIAGKYSNGFPYVEESYWDPRGHWSGRRLEPPTHWMPLPAPPRTEELSK